METLIRNKYVFELSDAFISTLDLKALELAFNKYKDPNVENSYVHFSKEPVFREMRERMPFLAESVSLFKAFDWRPWPVHTDCHSSPDVQDRMCALNICVGGDTESLTGVTSFYDAPDLVRVSPKFKLAIYNRDTSKLVFSFRMRRPCLLNVQHPHDIRVDKGVTLRRLVSWSVSLPMAEASAFFEENWS